jgi:hypothetical protein
MFRTAVVFWVLLALPAALSAQPPKAVQAFLVVNSADKALLDLKYDADKKEWIGLNTETGLKCTVDISDDKSFLKIKDDGNGKGATTVCIKIIEGIAKDKIMLVTKLFDDGYSIEGNAKLFKYDDFATFEISKAIPDINKSSFLPKDLTEEMKPYYKDGTAAYNYNNKTNLLAVSMHYTKLRMACINGFEKACEAEEKNTRVENYLWNAEQKRFVLKN